MDTTVATISTLISSIAVGGAVLSVLLQSRQLRTSQIQASRQLHGELIRLAMDYPSIASDVHPGISAEDYQKYAFLNLLLESWEMGYSVRTISARTVQRQARTLFNSVYARRWWETGRTGYDTAATKSEKEFFELVDGEFAAITLHERGTDPDDNTNTGMPE